MKSCLFICLLLIGVKIQAQQAHFKAVDFHKADSIAALYKGESIKNLPLLAYNLTTSLPTKVEQFRAIYIWVSTNIENDYWSYRKNKYKREKLQKDSLALLQWNRTFRAKVFRTLLREKKTVCTGYAYLIKTLASLADIECKIIDGYGRSVNTNVGTSSIPNHSWNAVKLNGRWYLCDATWSSGEIHKPANKFIHDYNDGYFLANPTLFVQNHYPLDTTWVLMDKKPTFTDFLNAPLVYKHAFSEDITPIKPQKMHTQIIKGEALVLLVKAPVTVNIQDISLELVKNGNSRVITPYIYPTNKGLLQIKYPFPKTGFYDVHLKIGQHYITTYTVSVRKK
ncbi:hypothetical protein BKI52_44950 [marine bacterium AO1-C]|nr:hypothetical protein BKI52_44950 [marine bacterium AO1-C]